MRPQVTSVQLLPRFVKPSALQVTALFWLTVEESLRYAP